MDFFQTLSVRTPEFRRESGVRTLCKKLLLSANFAAREKQSSAYVRSKGNNLWIADTVIFFEGTWDVGMGCSFQGREGRQAKP